MKLSFYINVANIIIEISVYPKHIQLTEGGTASPCHVWEGGIRFKHF